MAEYIDRGALQSKVLRVPLKERSYLTAMELIDEAPAADVKPVVHAHFYIDDGCAYCSNCRNNFKKAILKAAKFCPMCGAQIDGYGGHPDAGPPTPYDLLHEEGGVGV